MLKRFMNWLLHRLQRLLGVISGKNRGKSRSGAVSQSPFVLEHKPTQPPQFDDSRVPSEALDDTLPESIVANDLSSPSQQVSSQQGHEAATTDILDPMLAEPDTHRRLNASSAALPGAVPQVPSFPTEVSELISSSPAQSVTSSAEPEQLPAIHDLLPAIEPDESEDSPEQSVPQAVLCSFDITESDVSSVPTDSAPTDSVPTVEPFLSSEATPVESLLEVRPESVPSSSTSIISESIPEVVLSTGEETIIEDQSSDINDDSDIDVPIVDSAAEIIDETLLEEQEPDQTAVQQPLVVEEEKEDLPLEIVLDDSIAVADATAYLTDEPSASDLLPAVENEPLEPVQEKPDEADIVTAQVAGLPYPWSLAASNKATQTTAEVVSGSAIDAKNEGVSERTDSENTDERSLESESDSSTSTSLVSTETQSEVSVNFDETSLKNGVVKLLFTLKPGNFHGYIAPDDGTQDILFHQKYINADAFEQLSRGAKVVVTVKYIEGKAYAKQVDLL